MTDLIVPMATTKGVVVFDEPRPTIISEAIEREVAKAIAKLPADRKAMAELNVGLTTGVNVVFAYRDPLHGWTAGAYVGSRWDGDLQGGVTVRKVW